MLITGELAVDVCSSKFVMIFCILSRIKCYVSTIEQRSKIEGSFLVVKSHVESSYTYIVVYYNRFHTDAIVQTVCSIVQMIFSIVWKFTRKFQNKTIWNKEAKLRHIWSCHDTPQHVKIPNFKMHAFVSFSQQQQRQNEKNIRTKAKPNQTKSTGCFCCFPRKHFMLEFHRLN